MTAAGGPRVGRLLDNGGAAVRSGGSADPEPGSDVEVQAAVLEALRRVPGVRASDFGVTVHFGVVTLTGEIPLAAEAFAAVDAAHSVQGVLDVVDDTRLRRPSELTRSATEVALSVRRALDWVAGLPPERIRSTVTRGSVLLSGVVETPAQREAAAAAIRELVGVCAVRNEIEVGHGRAVPRAGRSAAVSTAAPAGAAANRADVEPSPGAPPGDPA